MTRSKRSRTVPVETIRNFTLAEQTRRLDTRSTPAEVIQQGDGRAAPQSESFPAALAFQMRKHGDTCKSLVRAAGHKYLHKTRALSEWRTGRSVPWHKSSLNLLTRIEELYGLPGGYFAKLITASHPAFKSTPRKLNAFQAELNFQMRKHGDSSKSLAAVIWRRGESTQAAITTTLTGYKIGRHMPQHQLSFVLLERIELYYRLPVGYFSELIAAPTSASKEAQRQVTPSLRSVFRWHLPSDFEQRPKNEQEEIVTWITANVLGCATKYGKYQSRVTRNGFAVVFPEIRRSLGGRTPKGTVLQHAIFAGKAGGYGTIEAPPTLAAEIENLVAFKVAVLPPSGYRRYQSWAPVTAIRYLRAYGMLFGALAAAPLSPVGGFGLPLAKLTFGLLVFPAIWDWYLDWRERRRGFLTNAERSMLYEAKSAVRDKTGWIRQHPELAKRIRPIKGLISDAEVAKARRNWPAACDRAFRYACERTSELSRVTRVHRDPFETIMPVLETGNPLGAYKRIADEVLRLMPNEDRFPLHAALSVRSYLLLRFAMHMGVRQRNLRELLLCRRGDKPRGTSELEELKCGEIRWNDSEGGWEVFIPAIGFKNSGSSFFKGRPYRLRLPDLERLYNFIDVYVERHRPFLLNNYPDPGTFFVRSAKSSPRAPIYDMFSMYGAWKDIIQRYGIYNPYTGRGAIKGLLPHGPHSVRDVLATHVLKQTESYELAGFAIQDTSEAVQRHYTQFLPHEKVARVAPILNKVWQSD